jgi:hypothetical protein
MSQPDKLYPADLFPPTDTIIEAAASKIDRRLEQDDVTEAISIEFELDFAGLAVSTYACQKFNPQVYDKPTEVEVMVVRHGETPKDTRVLSIISGESGDGLILPGNWRVKLGNETLDNERRTKMIGLYALQLALDLAEFAGSEHPDLSLQEALEFVTRQLDGILTSSSYPVSDRKPEGVALLDEFPSDFEIADRLRDSLERSPMPHTLSTQKVTPYYENQDGSDSTVLSTVTKTIDNTGVIDQTETRQIMLGNTKDYSGIKVLQFISEVLTIELGESPTIESTPLTSVKPQTKSREALQGDLRRFLGELETAEQAYVENHSTQS